MSNTEADFQKNLVAAVEAELIRHGAAVVAEVDRLRDQMEQQRKQMRAEFTAEIASVQHVVSQITQQQAGIAQQVSAKVDADIERARTTVEQRLTESESRQTRRLDDLAACIDSAVLAAARPLLADVKTDHEAMGIKVDHLESQLRKFDEQAARMVTYFNDVSQRMEAKQEELAQTVATDVASQLSSLRQQVEDGDQTLRRFQSDLNQSVSQRMADTEERITTKLVAAESRMKDDNTQRISEVDARVTRASASLDEAMNVVNDRVAGFDDKFINNDRRVAALEESVQGIDQEAIEVLKNKMSAAAGEAMLVRIEMERFEKATSERADTLAIRITEVETQVQDATMDVSTAVQLDRLEEIERALLELDPNNFVLKDPFARADRGSYNGASSGASAAQREAEKVPEAPTFDASNISDSSGAANRAMPAMPATPAMPAPAAVPAPSSEASEPSDATEATTDSTTAPPPPPALPE